MSSCVLSANKQEVFFYTTSLQGACSDTLKILHKQHAKEVVSDSLVYFAIGLVNSVLTRSASRLVWGNSNYSRTIVNPAYQFFFLAS